VTVKELRGAFEGSIHAFLTWVEERVRGGSLVVEPVVPVPPAAVIGALFQIAMLVALAYRDAHLGRVRSFNTWTALIALRLLIVYFEVFGSMLDTGLGLITGGLLTLALGWAWRKKSPALARQLSEDPHGQP
jgi:hypothetical protein